MKISDIYTQTTLLCEEFLSLVINGLQDINSSRQFMNYLVLTNVYPIYFLIYFNKRRHSHH